MQVIKLLIIGSKGFIGSHCTSYFLKKGWDVYMADIIESFETNYIKLDPAITNFDVLFKNKKFDVCINCSGSANVSYSFENPSVDFNLNVLNVQKILCSILQNNIDCKFINISSAAVYGNPLTLPIIELHEPNPLSPYGLHKLQSELLLKGYHDYFGLKTTSLRVFSVFGPGLKKQLFWDLYKKAMISESVELFGNGNETRDFIFINDFLNALGLVIKNSKFNGDVINIANGQQISIKSVTQIFKHNFHKNVSFVFSGVTKVGDPSNWQADINCLKSYGYKQSYDFEEGVKLVLAWMKENQ